MGDFPYLPPFRPPVCLFWDRGWKGLLRQGLAKGSNLFLSPCYAVEPTGTLYSIPALKSIASRETPALTSLPLSMSYPLDINLRRVAKLKQVTIKTARDWRDSENLKWFNALEELVRLRKERGRDIINLEPVGFFESLASLEVDSERMDIQETQHIQESLADLASLPRPAG